MADWGSVQAHPVILGRTAYDRIKTAIMENQLKPGVMLQERSLAASLGVSRTPVREALRQLEKDGLVEFIPGKGALVRRISLEDVRDIMQIRQVLEGMAARLAAENASPSALESMTAAVDEMDEAFEKGDLRRFTELDLGFHEMLYTESGNQRLHEILNNLRDQVTRLTILSRDDPDRQNQSRGQHRRILEAVRRRDGDEAERCMSEHVTSVRAYLSNMLLK
ncbi:MAG: GntR family transcriptional regulator [Firmicutes bacterium]|nr:GntR family transcriptional regulator [Bacillota bacterium]